MASMHPTVASVYLFGAVLHYLCAPKTHVIHHTSSTFELLLIFNFGGMEVILKELAHQANVIFGLLFWGWHRVYDFKSTCGHVDVHQKPVVTLDVDRDQNIGFLHQIHILFVHNPLQLFERVLVGPPHVLQLREEERIKRESGVRNWVNQSNISVDNLVIEPLAGV